jgi:hypothetical protein
MTLEQTIDEFLSTKYNYAGYKKTTVNNLLKEGKEHSLLYINGSGEFMADDIIQSIKESVKMYKSNKDSAIDIYKRYIKFLEDKYGIRVDIDFPPIPVSISFERIMFIAKYLQDPAHEVSSLVDILWVSSRTIEDDIAKLRGNTDDPLQVCGKKFIIDDIERRKGKVTMSSTAHPLFITSNLTQVIVTLKGLKIMGQDPMYKRYADEMARSIWVQLSDYARNRIIYVTTELLPDEVEWYLNLADNDNNSFYSEYMCSNSEGAGCVLDCLKNGKSCFVEYKGEDDSVKLYPDCTIKHYRGETIVISYNSHEIELQIDNILRSSYTIEELI